MVLSEEQKKIDAHRNNHALISACPGSGKTTTLVEFILSLLEDGVKGPDILVLMFGKDPQLQFTDKLSKRSYARGILKSLPEVRTYHSLAYLIIRNLEQKGLVPKCELITSEFTKEIAALFAIRSNLSEHKFKELQNKDDKVTDEFMSFVDIVKAELLTPKEVFELHEIDEEYEFFIKAFDTFEEKRTENHQRYFSDLIYDLVLYLRANEDAQKWLGNKKQYIIVDEYQDTNNAQSELLGYIAGTKGNIIATGDVDQAIFNFTGARPDIMMTGFKESYPNHDFYTLSKTFRYTNKLAKLSNNIIINNKERFDAVCMSDVEEGTNVFMKPLTDDYGSDFANKCKQIVGKSDFEYNDIALLVRVYSNAVAAELSLLSNGIPYNMTSNNSCLNTREFKGIHSLYRIITGDDERMDPHDRVSMYADLLKFPSISIEAKKLEFASKNCANKDGTFRDFIYEIGSVKIHPFMVKKANQLLDTVQHLKLQTKNNKKFLASAALKYYEDSVRLIDGLAYSSVTSQEKDEAIARYNAFFNFVKSYKDITPIDAVTIFNSLKNADLQNPHGVTISSVHKAKGLEWPIVFIPGLTAGNWPHVKDGKPADQESERRLLYVAMTRGIKEVYFYCSGGSEVNEMLATGKKPTMIAKDCETSKFVFEFNIQPTTPDNMGWYKLSSK